MCSRGQFEVKKVYTGAPRGSRVLLFDHYTTAAPPPVDWDEIKKQFNAYFGKSPPAPTTAQLGPSPVVLANRAQKEREAEEDRDREARRKGITTQRTIPTVNVSPMSGTLKTEAQRLITQLAGANSKLNKPRGGKKASKPKMSDAVRNHLAPPTFLHP